MVDIQRKKPKGRKWLSRLLILLLLTGGIAGGTYGLSRLEPAHPTVDVSVVYGTVTRGTMLREVSGRGPLVPVDVNVVTAEVGGVVAKVILEPGVEVKNGAALIELSDPVTERNLVEARRSLRSAENDRDRYKLLLELQELELKEGIARARAAWEEAREEAEMKQELVGPGYISVLENQRVQTRANRSWELLELQLARVENSQQTNALQLQDKEEAVARAEAIVADRQREVDALTIRATCDGILQELGPSLSNRWEVGERIGAGARVAMITNPQNLKAVLEVSDMQAQEVMIDQPVTIDTRTAEIPGRVIRVDPAVLDGRVAVDVELLGDLPPGARPDLQVNGKILIEQLNDVLQLSPFPAFSDSNSTITLFRVTADGTQAVRTTVELGRGSLNTVEIVAGLQEGDRVITSDMKRFDDADRVILRPQ